MGEPAFTHHTGSICGKGEANPGAHQARISPNFRFCLQAARDERSTMHPGVIGVRLRRLQSVQEVRDRCLKQ